MITLTKTEKCIYRGIIYRYINKKTGCIEYDYCYVGCTTNEEQRRAAWKNRNNRYAGRKIAEARELYFDFMQYEVVAEFWGDNIEELRKFIHKNEKAYIKIYDSERKGYNMNQHKPKSEKHRQNISKARMGHEVSEETRKKISDSHSKTAVWITTPTDGTVLVESMVKASEYLGRTIGFVYGRLHTTNPTPKDNIIITFAA